jgi:hypothetical protein
MKRTIFLLAGLGFALPAVASPTASVKCGANQERVWVYDNLTTLNVNVRLKCGAAVSIEGLEKGYVRILTAEGNEGYVPADAIPSSDLAQLKATEPAVAPAPVSAVAAAAPLQRAPQPVAAAQPAAQPVQQSVAIVQTAPAAPARIAPRPVPVVTEARANVTPAPTVAAVTAPPIAPAPAAPAAQQTQPAPTYIPTPAQTPVVAPSTPVAAHVQAPLPHPSAPARATVANPAEITMTVVATAPRPAPQMRPAPVAAPAPRANPGPASRPAEREDATLVIEPVAAPAPVLTRQPAATVVKAADYTPLKKNAVIAGSMRDVYSDDDEDSPEITVRPAINLAACTVFFSAYGLTPMQFKWMAEDRSKRFPGVCPAPEPSMVDYVVIFTHDLAYFTTTLPDAIHTDKNGFSDWSPITAADNTMIPVSSLDKAHREYAWVFHVRRGSFDPSKFTERRHPQFTKSESSARASSRTIEDAIQFISENGPSVSLNQ